VNALGQRIARLIEAQGPISIAQFMTVALHDPVSGYYATRDPFGGKGDFITAPEISQMFGELLGLWIAQCWHDQKRPRARLVELGPGRGTLMNDALRVIQQLMPEFLTKVEIVLIEASPALTGVQKKTLAASGVKISWAVQFDDALGDLPLFLLANEFFDALPIRQFVKTARGWCERMVVLNADGALDFALAPEAVPSSLIPANRGGAPMGAFYETSPAATALTQQIAEIIAREGGAALIVDYGYGAEGGFGETLQAVSNHKYARVLEAPGDADISAHVDFAALDGEARAAGAKPYGPVGQGDLLEATGIVQRAATLARGQLGNSPAIDAQLERLIQPDQMGILFKALAILPDAAPTPPGF
jgi:SAM-dependent MidA family methyltransferase